MSETSILLPGEQLPQSQLPRHSKKPLVLGPGLRLSGSGNIISSVAGTIAVDARKNAIWIEHHGGKYIPRLNDQVIVTVDRATQEAYSCCITPYGLPATLPQLAFEGATKKTRPKLDSGALLYVRISLANRDMDPEISCISATSGKADGLGELTGGMIFNVSTAFARRLLMSESKVAKASDQGGGAIAVLQLMAEKITFETAVGRNGKVWVNSDDVRATIAVGKVLTETDEKSLNLEQQRKLVNRVLRELLP